jgi:hypothetical protein
MYNFEDGLKLESIEGQAIKKLEEAHFVGLESKMLILATFLDFKPLSEISVKESPVEIEKSVSELFKILDELGLYHDVDPSFAIKSNSIHYLISKDRQKIEDFRNFINNPDVNNSSSWHRKRAILFGFPETAISDIDSEDLFKTTEIPEEVTDDERNFLFFRLSRKSWRVEIEWLRKIMYEIKRISPLIYKEITDRQNVK